MDTGIAPDENLPIVMTCREDRVLRVDEQAEGIGPNDSSGGKSDGIGIPRGIGTEFRLMKGDD